MILFLYWLFLFLNIHITYLFILIKLSISFIAKDLKNSDTEICLKSQYFLINCFSLELSLNSNLSSRVISSSFLNIEFINSIILLKTTLPHFSFTYFLILLKACPYVLGLYGLKLCYSLVTLVSLISGKGINPSNISLTATEGTEYSNNLL